MAGFRSLIEETLVGTQTPEFSSDFSSISWDSSMVYVNSFFFFFSLPDQIEEFSISVFLFSEFSRFVLRVGEEPLD